VIPLELESAPPPAASGAAAPDAKAQSKSSDDSAALTEPARAGSVVALPPLEPAPGSGGDLKPAKIAALKSVQGTPPRDSQVILTSGQKPEKAASAGAQTTSPALDRRKLDLEPGRPVAKIGDEIITYHDMLVSVREHRAYQELKAAYKDPSTRREAQSHINMLMMTTLNGLIDRSLLVKEAKKKLKDPKMLDRFYEESDQVFREREILPLQRQYACDSESQLKERLAQSGRSLNQMQQSFRQSFLADQFLYMTIKDKTKVELPDLLKYYDEHVKKHEFDRPALITWREIVVEPIQPKNPPDAPHDSTVLLTSASSSRETARREAESLLEKLRRGEDFAKLARKESDGPAGSRNQGGLMETSPGGYGIKPVSAALDTLPIGRLSDVIEGPDGFHIVKVEKRRPAGPASFEEVQNEIRPILENQKFTAERAALIAKLRKNTLIIYYDMNPRKKPAKSQSAAS
jgi:parvulin-like peptidyl-prolyl isomerase